MNAAGSSAEAVYAGGRGHGRGAGPLCALQVAACCHLVAGRLRPDPRSCCRRRPLPPPVRKISVKTVAKAAAKKTATGVIHRWAGADQPGGASSTSLASKGGSKGGSADDLAASAGPATPGATPAGKAAM